MDAPTRVELFEREARPLLDSLYAFAYRMTRDAAAADDLVQDTLLRAFQNIDRFERGTNFRAWIFRIMTNHFINQKRREALAPRAVEELDSIAQPQSAPAYFSVDEINQLGDQVGDQAAAALAKVPEDFRIVFLLAALCDFSYREIADFLDIPAGTVMSRLFRARKILRAELEPYRRERGFAAAGSVHDEVH